MSKTRVAMQFCVTFLLGTFPLLCDSARVSSSAIRENIAETFSTREEESRIPDNYYEKFVRSVGEDLHPPIHQFGRRAKEEKEVDDEEVDGEEDDSDFGEYAIIDWDTISEEVRLHFSSHTFLYDVKCRPSCF